MGSELFEVTQKKNEPLKESQYLFDELFKKARSDKKRSLTNIKAALDYLCDHYEPSTVTYNDIAEYISRAPGNNLKEKTPKTGQQIKNDKGGMKRYVDLRKLEAKVGIKDSSAPDITRAKVDDLLQEDKESLVDQLILAQQLNIGYVRKIRQHEKISNQTKIVIENIKPSQRIPTGKGSDSIIGSLSDQKSKLMNSEKDLVIDFFQVLTEEFNAIKFTKEGVFFNKQQIGQLEMVDALAKTIGMSHAKFIDSMN